MIEKPRLGLTKVLRWALGPVLVASTACTATLADPGGGSSGSGQGPNGSASAGSPGSGPNGANGANGASSVALHGAPLYSRFLRLTNSQWENSVTDILRLNAPTGQSEQLLHAVSGTTDFDNNERVVIVGNENWSDFQFAAETVAAKVTASDQALQAVVATTDAAVFIKTFGRRAFRRELTPAELATYSSLHEKGAQFSGSQSAFTKGAGLVIAGMLQSPSFLYRAEMADDGAPLSGYEMAAKLSLWIRNTTPSDAMLDAAAQGAFDSATGARAQAQAMLDDPAAVGSIRQMHSQLYKLERLSTITKDKVEGYSDGLRDEFTVAATSFFDYIYSQNLGVKDLLTTNVAFAGPLMAELYGLKLNGSGVQTVKLENRAGWYTQAPFLAQWSVNNDPDPIHRGVRVDLDTLCLALGTPAADLPPVPKLEPNQTNRQRYEGLTTSCGAPCHTLYINPVGFAFEAFDGLGRFRTSDNGQPLNTAGSYPFAAGTQSFAGANDLMQTMAASTEAHQCWSKKLASYALERDIVADERPLVEALGAVSASSGGSLKEVMLALVQHDAFRTRVGGAK